MANTEKDLGVMINDDLKSSNQCSKVDKTANKLVGFIGRFFFFFICKDAAQG